MKKYILHIIGLLLCLGVEAQNYNPLIPSKKNDRLIEQAQNGGNTITDRDAQREAQREAQRNARQAAREANAARRQALKDGKGKPGATKQTEEAIAAQKEESAVQADTEASVKVPEAEEGKAPTEQAATEKDSAVLAATLPLPPVVATMADYDANTGAYIMRTKIGDTEISTPYMLTADEYKRYTEQELMHNYWQKKISEAEHSGMKKFDITDMKFNIGPADKVFGPGGVQIKMNGSAELLLGFKHKYTNNPSLTERARSNNVFDFDEKIQVGVNAKVGTKLAFNMNYNTEASFSFDQQMLKLTYKGEEDDIIQSLEAGNVTMDLNSSLIQGAQALFGVKTHLQFGKLKVQALVSQQNSQSQTVNSQGGAQMTTYEFGIDQYDENRHFFLSYFFRDKYEAAMENMPVPGTGVTINKIEVWVTNRRGNFDNSRNIIAFADLAETDFIEHGRPNTHKLRNTLWTDGSDRNAANNANSLYNTLAGEVRDITALVPGLGYDLEESLDYERIESARLLSSSEYTLNSVLGFISLKSALRQDEVLAVAYEYTYQGKVYQVGEFSTDPLSGAETSNSVALVAKLLKTNGNGPYKKQAGTWDLMMKNVYSLGANSVSQNKFVLDIYYRNDSVGTQIQYLSEGPADVLGKPLLRVMGLDRLDSRNNPYADGKFDWVEGYTIQAASGRIIFPVLEPFGDYLTRKLGNPTLAEKYTFPELYDSTLVVAQEMTEKNKFVIRGKYSGSAGNQINLGAMNVPRGSVVVTAGGATLVENVDYTVDYISGIVTIINQSILDAGTNISCKLENQSTFSLTRKTLIGAHLEYNFTPDLMIGGTVMHMSERPLTTKVTSGMEPISNTIWGLNFAWRTELPWLNAGINAIPWMKAEAPSTFSINGEFAHLIPGHTSEVGKVGTSYLDDFENTKTDIDMHYPSAWFLASTPRRFNEATDVNQASYNAHRALLNWYTVDPIFGYPQSNTPNHIRNDRDAMSDHRVRVIYEQEIYPNKEVLSTEDTRLAALSLSYYPEERGPYNIDASSFAIRDGKAVLKSPRESWGGMMRRLDNTDFEKANIEYIEFWLMDPAKTNPEHPTDYHAKLYFNLGDISEDVLRDGKKSFEHGLPTNPDDETRTQNTFWGRVPRTNSTVTAFSSDAAGRRAQDVGLNGLPNHMEYDYMYNGVRPYGDFVDALLNMDPSLRATWEVDSFSPLRDPAGDRYHYYRGTDYDDEKLPILMRYKRYNNPEGNSPATEDQHERYGTAATLTPDGEDINSDNTLSQSDKYYEYMIDIDPNKMQVGMQHITSSVTSKVSLQNGEEDMVTWYQFKIPLKGQGSDSITNVGGIRNLKNVRFMRVYMTDADRETHLRLATLNLVRGEWRNYNKSLIIDPNASESAGTLDVQAINIEENGRRTPVNYVLPPGISRQTDPGQAQLVAQNEQAMVLRVRNLGARDARAVYKQTAYDMRNYKRLKMFVHAEKDEQEDDELADGDISCFIRLGSDLRYNYYEYEIPLSLTPHGTYRNENEQDRMKVWPEENAFDFPLSVLTDLKLKRNREKRGGNTAVTLQTRYSQPDNDKPLNTVTVIGNPTLEDVQYILIGVRHRGTVESGGRPHTAEVWVNELRLSEFNENGGMAAMANASLAISDIAQFNISGRLETAGYGSIESNVQSRNMDDHYQLQLSAALEAGRLFPEKAKLQIPLYVSYSSDMTSPKYDPLDTDVKLSESLDTYANKHERDSVASMARTREKSTTFSVSNLKVNIHSKKKDMFYDPANFSISASYSKQEHFAPDVVKDVTTDQRGSFTYQYNFNPKPWEPGKKSKNKSKFVQEFNIYYLPQSWGFSTTMHRQFSQAQRRELTGTIEQSPIDMATWSKDFTWDRNFNFSYNLTRNMKFSLQTAMNSTVDEGLYTREIIRDYLFENNYYEAWKDTIQRSLAKWGTPYTYQQVFTASWNVPFNRVPGFDALNATGTYNATYNWARTQSGSTQQDLGNTISSVQSWQVDGGLNLETWYQRSKYWKDMTQYYQGRTRTRAFKPKTYTQTIAVKQGESVQINHRLGSNKLTVSATDSLGKRVKVTYKVENNNTISLTSKVDCANLNVSITSRNPNLRDSKEIARDMFAYMGTMIRKVQVTYRSTNALSVPGFRPQVGFFGQTRMSQDMGGGYAPGWDFAFGFIPSDFISKAQQNHWLSADTTTVQPATQSRTSDLDIRLTLEPLPGLKIQVTGKRNTSSTKTTIYSYGDLQENITGSFNITQVALATMFRSYGNADNNFQSAAFDRFLEYRDIMQQRVQSRYTDVMYPNSGFMAGHIYSEDGKYDPKNGTVSRNNSDVLVPAFLAAYTGRDINKMSFNPILSILSIMPNWSVTYDGLGKLPGIREHFRSFSITHAYTCKYNIGSYASYSTWVGVGNDRTLGFTRDVVTDNPLPTSSYNITNVTLSENFSPLVGVNMTLKNSVSFKSEYRRQRNLALNITSVQLTEGHSDEFIIGGGYTFKDLGYSAKNLQGQQKRVSNDLKLTLDIGYKDIKTFLRKIDEQITQTSSGNKVFTLKFAADYVISQKINLQLFYDHESTIPMLSTAYPVRNDNVGLNVKIMLTR